MFCEFEHKIFQTSPNEIPALALEIFRFQVHHNPVYRQYLDTLHTDIDSIQLVEQIPFLPIQFFKTHSITTNLFEPQIIFESSGTGQTVPSHHSVKDLLIYQKSFFTCFEKFYGPVQDWCIIGLLPSYLERKNSSLVYMVNELVKQSGHALSGFYLDEYEKLGEVLQKLERSKQKTLLIGVSFALLEFAGRYPMPLKHTIIMETGGMKGRREEMTRDQLHTTLKESFRLDNVHSEYGMTELLSQAYSTGDGIFQCPPWMQVMIREEDDPFAIKAVRHLENILQMEDPHKGVGQLSGVINIMDLANIYSCSFIATEDVGRLYADGSFEVLGRMDSSDIRGCSLLMADL